MAQIASFLMLADRLIRTVRLKGVGSQGKHHYRRAFYLSVCMLNRLVQQTGRIASCVKWFHVSGHCGRGTQRVALIISETQSK